MHKPRGKTYFTDKGTFGLFAVLDWVGRLRTFSLWCVGNRIEVRGRDKWNLIVMWVFDKRSVRVLGVEIEAQDHRMLDKLDESSAWCRKRVPVLGSPRRREAVVAESW